MDFNKKIEIQVSSSSYLNINSITSAAGPYTPLSGYVVEAVAFGQSSVRGYAAESAQRDGIQAAEAFLGPRNIGITVSVFGNSLGNFWDRVDSITSTSDPYPPDFSSDDGFRKLVFTSPTGSTSNEVYMMVRPLSAPQISINKNYSIGASSKGFATNTTISMVAKDPRKISTTERTSSISVGTTTVTYSGTYQSFPTIILTASGTSASYVLGGRTVALIGLSSGSTYYVDHSKNTVRVGSATGTLVPSKVNPLASTGFGYISPSYKTIVLSGSVSSGSIRYREAWL